MPVAFSSLKNLTRAQRKVDAFIRKESAKPLTPADKLMRNRPKATDNVGRTVFRTLPVEVALKLLLKTPKIDNQRHEEHREAKATHLDTLDLPQALYHLAYVEEEDKLYLEDGNTRKLRLLSRHMADYFQELHLAIHFYPTKKEALAAYNTFDSKKARKSGRNEVESLFRVAGHAPEKFNSPALQTGAMVTVLKNLAKVEMGTSTAANIEHVVKEYAPYFQAMDEVGIEERNPPGGAVLACVMLLASEVTKGKWNYVRDYLRGIKGVYTRTASHEIPSAFFQELRSDADQACFSKGYGTSGETPCKLMAPVFMDGFAKFMMYMARRDGRRAVISRKLQAEIAHLSARLRNELADKVKNKQRIAIAA